MTSTDVDQFLMFELCDVGTEIEDQESRVYAVVTTLAAAGEKIQESLLAMYMANVAVDKEKFHYCLAAFIGMDLIEVHCDCSGFNPECVLRKLQETGADFIGRGHREILSPFYKKACNYVTSLRESLSA